MRYQKRKNRLSEINLFSFSKIQKYELFFPKLILAFGKHFCPEMQPLVAKNTF